jgi:hypothetical protein
VFFIQRDFRDIIPFALFSQEKKSSFKYEGIILPRKVKLFCFGKVCYFHAIQMCCMYAEVATSSILLFLGRKEIGGIYESYCIA